MGILERENKTYNKRKMGFRERQIEVRRVNEKMENDDQETPKTSKNPQSGTRSVDLYAVQCEKCFKWRVIHTQEEFEDIRSRISIDPYICEKNPEVSCEDPADMEYDATRTWIIDHPDLPKTPKGFKRQLVVRRDFSKSDAYYWTPSGKKVRAMTEIASYLRGNPEHENLSLSNFSFHTPKIMEDTIPENIRRNGSANGNKKRKLSKETSV